MATNKIPVRRILAQRGWLSTRSPHRCEPRISVLMQTLFPWVKTGAEAVKSGMHCVAAIVLIGALTGCEPHGPKALMEGERLLREGRAEESVRMLQIAVEKLPREARAWNLLGLAYHAKGENSEAASAYGKALALDHRLSAARFNLGSLLLEQGQTQAAVNELTAYTLLQRQDINGWLRLAQAQMEINRSDLADTSYRTVLSLSPKHIEALNGLGMVQVSRRRYVDAIQFFQAALAENPNYGPALLNQAVVTHRHLNQKATALQKYRQYLALQPLPDNALEVQQIVQTLSDELAGVLRPKVTNGVATTTVPAIATAPTPAAPPPPVVVRTAVPPATVPAPVVKATPSPARELRSVPAPTPAPVATPPPAVAVTTPAVTPPSAPAPTVVKAPTPPPVVTVPKVEPVPAVTPADVSKDIAILPPQAIVPPPPDPKPLPAPAPAVPEEARSVPKPAPVPEAPSSAAEKDKRGFFTRMNPFRWGRRETAPNGTESAAAPAGGSSILRADPNPAPPSKPALESGIPETGFKRYAYRSFGRPRVGDRSKAVELVNKGVIAHQERRYEEEAAFYRSAMLTDPSSYDAAFNMGLIMAEQGNWLAASQSYEEALAIDPEAVSARYNLAVALRQLDYPVDAGHELERILQSNPNEAKALLGLANLHAQRFKQPRLARQYYLRFLEADPQHPKAPEVRFWLSANP